MFSDVERWKSGGSDRRTTAFGRNQRDAAKGNEKKDQRDKERDDGRQLRNFWEQKRRIILSDCAGPVDQRTGLGAPMVTGLMVPTAMEMERPDRRLLELIKTGRAYDTRHQLNTDEQAGQQGDEAGHLPGSAIVMHETKQVRHSPHLSHEKAVTLQTVTMSVYRPLLTVATSTVST